MPTKIMSLQERAIHIEGTSKSFKNDYPNTAKWLHKLAETILLPKVTVAEVNYILNEVFDAFKVDFVGSDENSEFREQCYTAYTKLIWAMIKKKGYRTSSKAFNNLIPAFESRTQALFNMAEIFQTLVASEDLPDKRRFYGLCFMYLILVEGVYDEEIRILYSIKKATDGIQIDYNKIKDKRLWDFRNDLEAIFFIDNHDRIRNSIAHARFKYDDKRGLMTFRDRLSNKKPEYYEELTLKEFGIKYYGRIENICRLDSRYMMLLGVGDLVRLPQPFGQTTLLEKKQNTKKSN